MLKTNKYITIICLSAALILGNCLHLYAQFTPPDGPPCDPEDANCPLDTWVILLVVAALILTTLHLKDKQKKVLKYFLQFNPEFIYPPNYNFKSAGPMSQMND